MLHVRGIEVMGWYHKSMTGKVREEEKEGVLYHMRWLVSQCKEGRRDGQLCTRREGTN